MTFSESNLGRDCISGILVGAIILENVGSHLLLFASVVSCKSTGMRRRRELLIPVVFNVGDNEVCLPECCKKTSGKNCAEETDAVLSQRVLPPQVVRVRQPTDEWLQR